jgi:hypothetical protein
MPISHVMSCDDDDGAKGTLQGTLSKRGMMNLLIHKRSRLPLDKSFPKVKAVLIALQRPDLSVAQLRDL